MRGGPTTGSSPLPRMRACAQGLLADHVDILGRPELNELIIRVVAGHGDDIVETIHSKILEYAERVPIYDN